MCVFCEIVKGNIPCSKVYEDDNTLAFLDLSQTTYGHTLVVPKKHYDNTLEMSDEDLKTLISSVQKTALLLKAKLNASGINILNNTGEAAGQTVMHTHFHIIPRYSESDTVRIEFSENKFDLDEIVSKVNG